MKKINFILCLFIATLFFSNCEKQEYNVDATIEDHTPYLIHEWELKKVEQIDAKAAPGQRSTLNITTAALKGSSSTIQFTADQFTATGLISEVFGTTGNWQFNNPEFPSSIIINGGNEVSLGRSILEFSKEFVVQRNVEGCESGDVVTSYIYVFEKN